MPSFIIARGVLEVGTRRRSLRLDSRCRPKSFSCSQAGRRRHWLRRRRPTWIGRLPASGIRGSRWPWKPGCRFQTRRRRPDRRGSHRKPGGPASGIRRLPATMRCGFSPNCSSVIAEQQGSHCDDQLNLAIA